MTRDEAVALRRVVAIAPPHRRLLGLTLLAGTVAAVAAAALLATSGALISKASLRPPVLSLSVLIVSVRAFGLTRAGARYAERLCSHDLALRALGRLRSAFFARLVPHAGAGTGRGGAELLARFVGDVDQLQDVYLRGFTPPLIAAGTALVTVAAAAVVLPAAGVVLVCGLLAGGVAVPLLTARVARRAGRRQAAARAALTAEVLELSAHAAELAVLGRAPERLARVEAADAALRRLARRDALAGALATGAGALAQGAAVMGTLLVAVPAVGTGRVDGILLAALVFLTMASFEVTEPLSLAAQQVGAAAGAARRVAAVLDDAPAVVDLEHPLPLPTGGDLEVQGLALALGGAPVLDGVDLRLAPGDVVALAGPSGAGKSTLATLLVRFRDPDAGRVLLGGTDVRDLAQADLRGAVRLVAQDARLFTTTVVENVRLARPGATDAEVLDALRAAGLEEWLDGTPDGPGTMVGEDGAEVSGGQRQRINVARALLADARFTVVDEPTAHLDPAAAAELLRALAARARRDGTGLLAIVHDPPDPGLFDRVLELRDGRLRRVAQPGSGAPLRR